jgi:sporulation protein YlmC with PRC-barrel domain
MGKIPIDLVSGTGYIFYWKGNWRVFLIRNPHRQLTERKVGGMMQTRTEVPVLSATTMIGDKVVNPQGQDLGKLEELMIDLDEGRIAYAVLSFGGFMGIGDKLFAIPWDALTVDTVHERIELDIQKETLKDAPGFDKDNWPETTDRQWLSDVYGYYGYQPYWS